MTIALVAASSVLIALLTFGYARELRLRRALQSLLTRSLTRSLTPKRDQGRTAPMKQVTRRCGVLLVAMWLPATTVGCSTSDSRLPQLAQQAMKEPSPPNQSMAETAQERVARDAQTRRELAESQQEQTMQLSQQLAAIDASRDRLEQERQEIARQRQRDPIVAAAIENAGILIACLGPLLLSGLTLWGMHSPGADDAGLAEILVSDLNSPKPRFFPAPLTRRPTACPEISDRAEPLDDMPGSSELPF